MEDDPFVLRSLAHLCGSKLLFEAIRRQDRVKVKRLIKEQRVSVHSRGAREPPPEKPLEVTALHLACFVKSEAIADLLIDLGANIESRDEFGSTPLMYACRKGLVSIVKKLLKKKCNIDSKNESLWTALHYACDSGYVEICEILVNNGAWIEAKTEKERTPLDLACWNKNLEVVKLLVDRDANIECQDDRLRTPFLNSSKVGGIEILEYLEEKRCEIGAENIAGTNAVQLACMGGEMKAIDWLVSRGFSLKEASKKRGSTTLHLACEGGQLEVAKMLVNKHGLELNKRNEVGMTSFLSAVISGNRNLIKWLYRMGCIPTVRNQWGNTALHLACKKSKEDVFFVLIETCVDLINSHHPTSEIDEENDNAIYLESINNDVNTLFLLACENGLKRIIEYLVKRGANHYAKNTNGQTGLHLCCEKGHTSLAELLINELGLDQEVADNLGETCLMKACKGGHVTTTDMLLGKQHWDLNQKNEKKENVLHLACNNRKGTKVALRLIKLDVSIHDKDENGNTPIMNACKSGLLFVVKYLSSVCSLKQQNKRGQTLLHIACENGHTDLAHFLIKSGNINVSEIDKVGYTAMAYACRRNLLSVIECLAEIDGSHLIFNHHKTGRNLLHLSCLENGQIKVVQFLLRSGMDLSAEDNYGKTALMLACENGLLPVTKFLLEQASSFHHKTKDEKNLLHLACDKGHGNVARYLIKAFSEDYLGATEKEDKYPLLYACESGLLSTAKLLLTKYRSLEKNSEEVLRAACRSGNSFLVDFLLSNGIDLLNLTELESLLKAACEGGMVQVVERVLNLKTHECEIKWKLFLDSLKFERAAEIAIFLLHEFSNDDEALIAASEKGCLRVLYHFNLESLRESAIPTSKQFLLHIACEQSWLNIAHFLLDLEMNCDELDEDGFSPLMIACKRSHLAIIGRLIERGCSLQRKTTKGESLLHLAQNSSVAELLLQKGLNIDDKDSNGNTPCMSACKRGHHDIPWLFLERGCSINERNKNGESLLHLAGSRKVTEFLLQKGLIIDDKDSNGNTPCMSACKRRNLDVVQLFLERGCLVNERNEFNQDVLHSLCQFIFIAYQWELFFSLVGKVMNSIANFDVRDTFGSTPLSYLLESTDKMITGRFYFTSNRASELLILLKRFVFGGASSSTKSTSSQSGLLHVLARLSAVSEVGEGELISFCQYFLDEGANPGIPNNSNEFPHELARGDLRKVLREAWEKCRYLELSELGETQPTQLKVILIGEGGAGKTTLLNSLRRYQTEKVALDDGKIHVDDSTNTGSRTAGIDIVKATVGNAGEVVFCDIAGQPNFHKTHSLFFSGSATIYVLVVDLTKEEHFLRASSDYWLCLVKCSIGSSRNSSVIIIGSRGDKVDGRDVLKRLQISLQMKFRKFLDFSNQQFILDCRVSGSRDMESVREHLSEIKAIIIENVPQIPRIVDNILTFLLPKLRRIVSEENCPLEAMEEANLLPNYFRYNKDKNYLSVKEDTTDALENVNLLENEVRKLNYLYYLNTKFFCLLIEWNIFRGLKRHLLLRVVQFLHGIGEIIEIDQYVILDPCWLCHSIIGPLMSPNDFPVHLEEIHDGSVGVEQIEGALDLFNSRKQREKVFFSMEDILKLLCELEVCYPIENETNQYRFPALIEDSHRNEMWTANAQMVVYVGRRLQRKDETDIIVPGTIPFLQTRSVVSLDPSPMIWKDGMILQKHFDNFFVEGLIELQEGARAIDVICRGPNDSEKECYSFVSEMSNMVYKVLDDRSPGTFIDRDVVLSTAALKELQKRPPAHKHTLIEIAMKKEEPVTIFERKKRYRDTLRDLLIVSKDHYCMLPRDIKLDLHTKLSREDQSCLETLGRNLGLRDTYIFNCSAKDLLSNWSRKESATVPALIKCLNGAGLPDATCLLVTDKNEFEIIKEVTSKSSSESVVSGEKISLEPFQKLKGEQLQRKQLCKNTSASDTEPSKRLVVTKFRNETNSVSENECLSHSESEKKASKLSRMEFSVQQPPSVEGDIVASLLDIRMSEIKLTVDVAEIVVRLCSNKWKEIGIALGYSLSEVENFFSSSNQPTNNVKLIHILEGWINDKGRSATVGRLLNACDQVKMRGAVEQEIEKRILSSRK